MSGLGDIHNSVPESALIPFVLLYGGFSRSECTRHAGRRNHEHCSNAVPRCNAQIVLPSEKPVTSCCRLALDHGSSLHT